MTDPINLICIIDDDPIYAFAVQKLFKMNNFSNKCVVFKNGQEALEGLNNIHNRHGALPDLILLDINMPIMDGWQFLEVYKSTSLHKKTPIFITSSSVDNLDVSKAKTNDLVRGYVNKPLNLNSLILIKSKCL
ncbi:response regulator [Olleya sp. Bg11-27]|uniref:response regulator n=1 Tax=Olleya sp. Bg11-27 TaxID=2058135 RepID=UPI000C3061B8|nr:response regulator [Olleya sp. Bg11-27]AUC75587.1 response regulator [Olleya sp. Bg11-27]